MAEKSTKTMTDQVKDEAAGMAEDARDKMVDKAKTEAKNLRNAAADEAKKAANAAGAAASEFDDGSIQARAINQIADRIEELAGDIRGADIDRLARKLRTTAERSPLMFVAGAILAGFAVTRFLSARGSDRAHRRYESGDPWSDDMHHTSQFGRHERTPDLQSRGSV